MTDKLVVFNTTQGNVSLTLRPSFIGENLGILAQNKARRIVRSSICSVIVKCRQSVDLCALTRMSAEEIKGNTDYHLMIRTGKLQVMEDSSLIAAQAVVKPFVKPVLDFKIEPMVIPEAAKPIAKVVEKTVAPTVPTFLPPISALPSQGDSNFVTKVEEREVQIEDEATANKRGRKPNKKGFFSK